MFYADAIAAFMSDADGEWFTARQIADAVGITTARAGKALGGMYARGGVERRELPRGSVTRYEWTLAP